MTHSGGQLLDDSVHFPARWTDSLDMRLGVLFSSFHDPTSLHATTDVFHRDSAAFVLCTTRGERDDKRRALHAQCSTLHWTH